MTDVSCVYMIKHKLDEEWDNIYIGSTCNLRNRICIHNCDCYKETNKKYNYQVYKYIRSNGDFENFEFIILEECEVEKLKRLEQSYIDVYKPTLNMCNANGLDKERYKQYQKQYQKEYNKKYQQIHKEEIKKYKKEYQQKQKEKYDCPCGGRFTKSNKARHEKSKKHQKYLSTIEHE